jgi:hypothetical protein
MEQDVYEVENSCLYLCAVAKIIVVKGIRKNTSKRFRNIWSKLSAAGLRFEVVYSFVEH